MRVNTPYLEYMKVPIFLHLNNKTQVQVNSFIFSANMLHKNKDIYV